MRQGLRRVAAWLALAVVASPPGAATQTARPADEAAAPCAAEAEALRRRWDAVAPPLAQPPLTPGAALRHWPTRALGVWIVEETSPSHAVLTRVEPAALTRVTWAAGCAATTESRPRPAAPAPAFTDADLARLLAGGGRGVLYLWSPHMPLSVDGYAAVADAARARGVPVDALLDPAADRTFARTAAAAHGLPAAAMRVADSVELQFRELALHAPSAAVYAEGRLVGSVLRGYRTAEEYGAFLSRVLDGR